MVKNNMAKGEFAARILSQSRKKKRWLKKWWKRKALGLKAKYDPDGRMKDLFRKCVLKE